MQTDISKLTIQELKALGWEQRLELDRVEQNISLIRQQISKLEAIEPKEKDGTDKVKDIK